ncbi:MAG: alpha-N-arabinofuranosidase [Propionibacteriales bacterium]|nr:alpha-N-arabinofuranosidase [Propionibacteriales bacterium]
MTHSVTLSLDPAFRIGRVEPRLFGSFVEHMGRCVYTGIFEPGHPTADSHGFRRDVLDLVRELGPTIVRYPGGNFVSGYRWEDGIGPVDERPRRLDLAWRTIESNQVGVDEFATWCRAAGVEPMMAVNLGTRGVQDATDLLEYCNHPEGSALSDLRRSNGSQEPHAVKVWCLGNELDGPWQVGHKTASEYARLAAETARAMRMVDPTIELVACGSSNTNMATFAAWEATVLEQCYDLVDFISLHNYYEPVDGDVDSFLACAVDLDQAIEALVATADHVGARLRSTRKLRLSVDEWNVWYQQDFAGQDSLEWAESRALIEDSYDVTDAVVVGSLLITLLRHADRVGIACQAQLVNVIAPILTQPGGTAWRQTIFHPFAQVTTYARGEVLRVQTRSPTYQTARYGDVALVDATATYDEQSGELTVFAVNRSRTEPVDITLDVRAFPGERTIEATTLHHDDPTTRNLADHADQVSPRTLKQAVLSEGHLAAVLPALSWSVIRLISSHPDASVIDRKEHSS